MLESFEQRESSAGKESDFFCWLVQHARTIVVSFVLLAGVKCNRPDTHIHLSYFADMQLAGWLRWNFVRHIDKDVRCYTTFKYAIHITSNTCFLHQPISRYRFAYCGIHPVFDTANKLIFLHSPRLEYPC